MNVFTAGRVMLDMPREDFSATNGRYYPHFGLYDRAWQYSRRHRAHDEVKGQICFYEQANGKD